MSEITAEETTRLSTNGSQDSPLQRLSKLMTSSAAEAHVRGYYNALESRRNTIASHYIPAADPSSNQAGPSILYCGNIIASGQELQTLFEKEMPDMHYDAQAFDCQVVNSNAAAGMAGGRGMSLLVIVSGNMRVGPQRESELKGFSETFVLVPNPQSTGKKPRGRGASHDWLVQSSNFRFVV